MPQPQPQRRYPLIRRQPATTAAPAPILATVRELVEDGTFHQVTVDEIALLLGRAGMDPPAIARVLQAQVRTILND